MATFGRPEPIQTPRPPGVSRTDTQSKSANAIRRVSGWSSFPGQSRRGRKRGLAHHADPELETTDESMIA